MPTPQGNRNSYDREKYDLENYKGRSLIGRSAGFLFHGPDVSHAALSGQPSMQDMAFPIPASVPKANNAETAENGSGGGTTDIQGGVVQDSSKLNQSPDARQTGGVTQSANPPAASEAVPSNHEADLKKARQRAEKKSKKDKKKKSAAKPVAKPATSETPTNTTPSDTQQPAGAQAQPATQ
jgi:hypothetical protein